MSSKTFNTISREECLIVSKEVLLNSNKKWQAATKLAIAEEYGAGISLLIISNEELIKSLILALDGYGFDLRSIKGINKFFKDHHIRHFVAFFMFLLAFGAGEIKAFFINVQSKQIDIPSLMNHFADIENYVFKKRYRIFRKVIQLKRELNWFSRLEKYRQDGFYCDYNDKLITPQNLSFEDFDEIYNKLKEVRSVGQTLVNALLNLKEYDDGIYVDVFELLLDNFKRINLYSGIRDLLESLGRDKPLDRLKIGVDVAISKIVSSQENTA